ncbi:MAG: hypothetical protein WAW82_09670, partial [Candidatus Lutibacillus vidarii]
RFDTTATSAVLAGGLVLTSEGEIVNAANGGELNGYYVLREGFAKAARWMAVGEGRLVVQTGTSINVWTR